MSQQQYFLVQRFACSECGEPLSFVYPSQSKETPKHVPQIGTRDFVDEPENYESMKPETISVEPCRFCIEKYTKPSKKLAEAVLELGGLVEEEK